MVQESFAESKDEQILHEPQAIVRRGLERVDLESLELTHEVTVVNDAPQLAKVELYGTVQVRSVLSSWQALNIRSLDC